MKTRTPLFRIDRLLIAALALLAAPQAQAQLYTGTTNTGTWASARWTNASNAANFTNAWVQNSDTIFLAGLTYTFAGSGTVTSGKVTVQSNATVTFTAASGTWGTGGNVRTLDVGTNSLLDFAANAISTAAGTGFIKTGSGVFAMSGSTYGDGFTLNGGTVVIRGVNTMGGGASHVLTISNGVIAANANRSMDNTKYGGGIRIAGNFQMGALSNSYATNAQALISDSASISFANNVSLEGATRTVTIGGNGAYTFSGVMSNGGLTVAAAAGATGNLTLSGANTYTGKTTINSGTVVLSGSGTAGATNSDLEVAGGLLNLSAGTKTNATFTLSGGTITNGTLQATSYALQGGTIISSATLGAGTATVTTGTTTLNGLLNAATLNVNSGTLTAGSAGRFTGTPTVTLSNGATLNLAGNETFGSLAGAGSVSNSAGRITAGGNNSSTTFSGVLSGAGELTKTGIGRLSLSGSSSYNGATAVSAGELNLSGGSIANSAVTVASGASLSGYGSVGTIGGAGAINPGNSPGILTTPQVNPSAGTTFNFEMTDTAPTYSNAASSVNDLIRITGATPFSQALAGNGTNSINIYFSGVALFTGVPITITGGFFTDQSTNLASSISGATYNYYFADAIGTNSYNGVNYYTKTQYETAVLSNNLMTITVTTVAQTANFGSGNVSGQVMQVQVIPEPRTYALLALAVAGWGAHAWRRRKQVS
jgi:autotransporter-associated beta strand protein